MIECRKEEKELDTMPPGRKKENRKKLNREKKSKVNICAGLLPQNHHYRAETFTKRHPRAKPIKSEKVCRWTT